MKYYEQLLAKILSISSVDFKMHMLQKFKETTIECLEEGSFPATFTKGKQKKHLLAIQNSLSSIIQCAPLEITQREVLALLLGLYAKIDEQCSSSSRPLPEIFKMVQPFIFGDNLLLESDDHILDSYLEICIAYCHQECFFMFLQGALDLISNSRLDVNSLQNSRLSPFLLQSFLSEFLVINHDFKHQQLMIRLINCFSLEKRIEELDFFLLLSLMSSYSIRIAHENIDVSSLDKDLHDRMLREMLTQFVYTNPSSSTNNFSTHVMSLAVRFIGLDMVKDETLPLLNRCIYKVLIDYKANIDIPKILNLEKKSHSFQNSLEPIMLFRTSEELNFYSSCCYVLIPYLLQEINLRNQSLSFVDPMQIEENMKALSEVYFMMDSYLDCSNNMLMSIKPFVSLVIDQTVLTKNIANFFLKFLVRAEESPNPSDIIIALRVCLGLAQRLSAMTNEIGGYTEILRAKNDLALLKGNLNFLLRNLKTSLEKQIETTQSFDEHIQRQFVTIAGVCGMLHSVPSDRKLIFKTLFDKIMQRHLSMPEKDHWLMLHHVVMTMNIFSFMYADCDSKSFFGSLMKSIPPDVIGRVLTSDKEMAANLKSYR